MEGKSILVINVIGPLDIIKNENAEQKHLQRS